MAASSATSGRSRRVASPAMQMASSSSTTIGGRNRRRVALMRLPSREDVYEGPLRLCHHNLVAPRWTAWTEANPGRRFYGCRFYYQNGGCGYFDWHDEDFGERANQVIKQLLDDIDKLYDENSMIRRDRHGRNFSDELDEIYGELEKLRLRRATSERGVKWDIKLKLVMAAMIVTWVWVLILYLQINI